MTVSRRNASAYIPGECNINEGEVTLRRRVGYVAVALSLIILYLSVYSVQLLWWRLLLVVPVFVAAVCFLQAAHRFCIHYGLIGRQNAEPGSTRPHTVTNDSSLQKDRQRSKSIIMQGAAIAIIITALSLLLPVVNT